MTRLKKIAPFFLMMFFILMSGPVSPAGAEERDDFFGNMNESLRTKPSSLFNGLTGTEFMNQMKEKYGRDKTVALFGVMSPKTELNTEKAKEITEFLTPEIADNFISFYTLAMREAGAALGPDDAAAKKTAALMYNELATKYLAGDPPTVELCDKNYGQSAKAKMTVMMRLTTMFLENF